MRFLLLVLPLVACGREADLVASDCGGEPCPVCDADRDCRVAHNPCTETAVCHHESEPIATIDIGCSPAIEYRTPVEDCGCIDQRCQPYPE